MLKSLLWNYLNKRIRIDRNHFQYNLINLKILIFLICILIYNLYLNVDRYILK